MSSEIAQFLPLAIALAFLALGILLSRKVIFAVRSGYFGKSVLLTPVISNTSRQHEPVTYWFGVAWFALISLGLLVLGLVLSAAIIVSWFDIDIAAAIHSLSGK